MMPMTEAPPGIRLARGWHNQIMLQLDGYPNRSGPFRGMTIFRSVPDMSDATLYRTFQIAESRFRFDLTSAMRRYGQKSSSTLGEGRARDLDGRVFMDGQDEPVARLTILTGPKKMRDIDPTCRDDYEHRRF